MWILYRSKQMKQLKFSKEMYSKIALIKAAYNFTDSAYVHLDSDSDYYYVDLEWKDGSKEVSEKEFTNEILAQSVRHEIYRQTKNIRELLLARAMATSVIVEDGLEEQEESNNSFDEDEILRNWFSADGADWFKYRNIFRRIRKASNSGLPWLCVDINRVKEWVYCCHF